MNNVTILHTIATGLGDKTQYILPIRVVKLKKVANCKCYLHRMAYLSHFDVLALLTVTDSSTLHVMLHMNALKLVTSEILFNGSQVAQCLLNFTRQLLTLESPS